MVCLPHLGIANERVIVRAGEHVGFTRVTVAMRGVREDIDVTLSSEAVVSLSLTDFYIFDVGDTNRRLYHNRVEVAVDDVNGLLLILKCECSVFSFKSEERLLVIDIVDRSFNEYALDARGRFLAPLFNKKTAESEQGYSFGGTAASLAHYSSRSISLAYPRCEHFDIAIAHWQECLAKVRESVGKDAQLLFRPGLKHMGPVEGHAIIEGRDSGSLVPMSCPFTMLSHPSVGDLGLDAHHHIGPAVLMDLDRSPVIASALVDFKQLLRRGFFLEAEQILLELPQVEGIVELQVLVRFLWRKSEVNWTVGKVNLKCDVKHVFWGIIVSKDLKKIEAGTEKKLIRYFRSLPEEIVRATSPKFSEVLHFSGYVAEAFEVYIWSNAELANGETSRVEEVEFVKAVLKSIGESQLVASDYNLLYFLRRQNPSFLQAFFLLEDEIDLLMLVDKFASVHLSIRADELHFALARRLLTLGQYALAIDYLASRLLSNNLLLPSVKELIMDFWSRAGEAGRSDSQDTLVLSVLERQVQLQEFFPELFNNLRRAYPRFLYSRDGNFLPVARYSISEGELPIMGEDGLFAEVGGLDAFFNRISEGDLHILEMLDGQ